MLSKELEFTLNQAFKNAREKQHEFMTIEHLLLALLDIPLNAGTSMVAAIALGICVDDTMHVMSRFHEELKHHASRQDALVAMVRAEAVPIFATSIALAAGFAVFATSSFEPVAHFGLLSALVILVALIGTGIWLLVDLGVIHPDSTQAIAWLALFAVGLILAVGLSWAHIWRRLSGQVELTDED